MKLTYFIGNKHYFYDFESGFSHSTPEMAFQHKMHFQNQQQEFMHSEAVTRLALQEIISCQPCIRLCQLKSTMAMYIVQAHGGNTGKKSERA